MKAKSTSTRRSFIRTAGTALSVPIAAAAATTTTAANRNDKQGILEERLAMLEDVNAICAINQEYARQINAGAREQVAALFANPSDAQVDPTIVSISADSFGERDVIEVAPDRVTASAIVHCFVGREETIEPSCPLVEMARQQGGGVVRHTAYVVFEHRYIKGDGVWKILRSQARYK